jgi:hypothetical protein
MAASICGTMPSVQPKAAAMLGRAPEVSATASVYNTPVPGDATTNREVNRHDKVMPCH